jgi:hypothetical protein
MPVPDPPAAPPTNASTRFAPPAAPLEGDGQSARLRRSVVGAAPPPTASGGDGAARMVACAYCKGSFRAVVKPQPYNLVCVHCGQLNRIDP